MQKQLTSLISTHGGAASLLFLRNLIAARLLGVEEFGIAAVFAIIAGLVEALTAMGVHQLLLRDRSVQALRGQSTLHLIQFGRGLLGAALVLVLAPPIGHLLDLPALIPALRCLAVLPLLAGLQHLDPVRAMRHRHYTPFALIQIFASLLSIGILIFAVRFWGDHRAMLAALLSHGAIMLALSHFFATRPFRFAFDQSVWAHAIRFARPILLNGFLLGAILQLEKLVVGYVLGPAVLGLVVLGMTLTVTPAMVLARAQQVYFLPGLSHPRTTEKSVHQLLWFSTGIAACLMTTTALVASAVPVLFGAGFDALRTLLPLFGILAGARLLRGAAVTLAIARNRAGLAVVGNLPRLIGLPIFFLMLAHGQALEAALIFVILSDSIGLVLIVAMLRNEKRRANGPKLSQC